MLYDAKIDQTCHNTGMDDLKRIGTKILELRKARGWTRERFAEELNCANSQVQKIEYGDALKCVRWLFRIGDKLGVNPAILISEEAERALEQGGDTFDEDILRRSITITLKVAEEENIKLTNFELSDAIATNYKILLAHTRRATER